MTDPALAPRSPRLFLLGRVELVSAEGESLTAEITQPKRQALLAYLARSAGTFQRRDTLLALLWPELDAERSRRALRAALHYLRNALGADVLVGRGQEEVGLDPDRIVVDVREFDAALDLGDEERALTLFAGDFLPGLHVSDASEFERWVDAERRSLRARAVRATLAASTRAMESGDLETALRHARRGIEIEPFDEGAARHLIELLARSGDRAGAVRVLERFAAGLQEALDLPLSAGMEQLAEEIREGRGERLEPLPGGRPGPAPTRLVSPNDPDSGAPVSPAAAGIGKAVSSDLQPPRGRRRRVAAVATVLLAAFGLVGLFWAIGQERAGEGISVASSGPTFLDRRVVIAPFENRTGDPSFDVVGRAAADWTAQGLMGTGMVEVVSPSEVLRSVQVLERENGSAAAPGAAMTLAEQTRSRVLVSGSYHRAGDSLVFQARISDAADGVLLRSVEPVAGAADAPEDLMRALREQIVGSLATVVDPRLASWSAAASQPPSFEAYRLYADGLDLFLQREYAEAEQRLYRAWSLDTTFTAPLIWAIYACANRAACDESPLPYLRYLSTHRENMAPWDRAMTDHVVAQWGDRDWDAAVEAAYRVLEYAPDSEWAYKLAYAAVSANRPREAVEALSGIDPDRGWMREWPSYWLILATAYHLLEEYEQQLEAVRSGQARFGQDRHKFDEIRALMALGRVEEAMEVVQRSRYETRALIHEFRAHGYPTEADTLARWMLRWREGAVDTVPTDRLAHLRYGALLLLAGRLERAAEILEGATEDVAEGEYWTEWLRQAEGLGELGVVQTRRGDRDQAAAIIDGLTNGPLPDLLPARRQKATSGYRFAAAARVAVALGDEGAAVQLLRRARENGYPHTRVHYGFHKLRDHPEARDLFRPRD